MRPKATLSVLLLLLVSIQAFAVACGARCGMTAVVNFASHPCGIASQGVSDHQAKITVETVQPCASPICNNDWTFLLSPVGANELGVSLLSLTALDQGVVPINLARSLQPKTDRSTRVIPAFDPLLSSLRV